MNRDRTVDVLVVGAGPAGLALAGRLATSGAGHVEVLEREQDAGGVPRHCHHGGFGGPVRPWLTGPVYARRAVWAAVTAGAHVRTGVSATGWAGPLSLETTSPAGLERSRPGPSSSPRGPGSAPAAPGWCRAPGRPVC